MLRKKRRREVVDGAGRGLAIDERANVTQLFLALQGGESIKTCLRQARRKRGGTLIQQAGPRKLC